MASIYKYSENTRVQARAHPESWMPATSLLLIDLKSSLHMLACYPNLLIIPMAILYHDIPILVCYYGLSALSSAFISSCFRQSAYYNSLSTSSPGPKQALLIKEGLIISQQLIIHMEAAEKEKGLCMPICYKPAYEILTSRFNIAD
ncbi:hypothetical protein EDC96DRAFT_541407 [Choanephora cucurbitarum]|nr:hypothetical protein EDC96DRAFT_541407 [Choanephora cucurbitarum]